MKKFLVGFLLALTLTAVTFPTAWAQEKASETRVVREMPSWVQEPPSPTNILTSFSIGGECHQLNATWVAQESRIHLSAFLCGGTNISKVELKSFAEEQLFEWRTDQSESARPFPAGLEKNWAAFAEELQKRYQIIGEQMFVETSPLKYLGKVERFTDGVVLESYLFQDSFGRYRVEDGSYWAGDISAKVGQMVYLGSNGWNKFTVEKSGERFLLTVEVFAALQTAEKERERIFPRKENALLK